MKNIGINIRTIIDSQISLALHSGEYDIKLYDDRQKIIDEMMKIFESLDYNDWLTTDRGITFELTFKPTKKIC